MALIDERAVIERIMRHLGFCSATGPPVIVFGGRVAEPWSDDPFPDYDIEPVMAYANG